MVSNVHRAEWWEDSFKSLRAPEHKSGRDHSGQPLTL